MASSPLFLSLPATGAWIENIARNGGGNEYRLFPRGSPAPPLSCPLTDGTFSNDNVVLLRATAWRTSSPPLTPLTLTPLCVNMKESGFF